MDAHIVKKWEDRKSVIRQAFETAHPSSYEDIVRNVVSALTDDEYEDQFTPDPQRIHLIDDGEYQGTLVFVIGKKGYQPSEYWYVKVWYGSCSGCDTLQAICGYSDNPPSKGQVDQYMTLALHIIQGLKRMGDES